jgi:hypothetical protein
MVAFPHTHLSSRCVHGTVGDSDTGCLFPCPYETLHFPGTTAKKHQYQFWSNVPLINYKVPWVCNLRHRDDIFKGDLCLLQQAVGVWYQCITPMFYLWCGDTIITLSLLISAARSQRENCQINYMGNMLGSFLTDTQPPAWITRSAKWTVA